MSKHKLFKPDDCSPLLSGKIGNMTPRENDLQLSKSKTPEQGLKRKKNVTAPVAKKYMKEGVPAESDNNNHPALTFDSENPVPSTSKTLNNDIEMITVPKTEKADTASNDDDDDDLDGYDFYIRNNLKLPYTYQEDEMIVRYVLRGQNIFRVSSISLWKDLERKKQNPKRTYQSLKNRFLRNIKPNLFTTYKHLINNKDLIDKILIKFPELKRTSRIKSFSPKINTLAVTKKPLDEPLMLNSSCNITVEKTEREESPPLDFKSESTDDFIFAPSPINSHKNSNLERTVKFNKNLIKVTVNLSNSNDLNVPYCSVLGLSDRFKKLETNSERIICQACGRYYRRPLPNDLSESDAESDVIIPDSVEPGTKNVSSVSCKSPDDVSRRMSVHSRTSSNSAVSQNLLVSLEKSDKLDGDSDINSVSEEVSDKDDIQEIIEIVEMPIKERFSEGEDKTTDSDSDIDLIYEHTVERFHKLVDANEDQTLQRKCLNKDQNAIGFNAIAEKNLDSFFLETPLEEGTPAFTNECRSQVHVNSRIKPSQRVTRSSTLASNMMKMLENKLDNDKNSQK